MHGGLTVKPFNGLFQGSDAPVIHLIEKHVKGGFIELDDIHTGRFQLPGFLVEYLGELPGQLFAAFVMGIVQRVDHRHGARQCPLDRLIGLLTQEPGVVNKHRLLATHSADHRGHAGIVAITNSNGLAPLEINAVEVFDEGGHEVLARLLAITDNINASQLLVLQ